MIRKIFSQRGVGLALAVLGLLAGPLHAQNIGKTTGGIRGVVKDTSGGVIPGATVTISSPALVGGRTAVTGSDGSYDFPGLAIGLYKVEATLSGFAPSAVQGLDLKAGQILKADLVLKPGGLTESVTGRGASERLHATVFSGMKDHRGVSYLVSADNGNTWSTPVPLGEGRGQHSDLASMGREVVTIYDVTDPDDGLAVGVKRSQDEGATWSAFSRLSPVGVKADFPRLVSVKGRFVAFWTEKDKDERVSWRMSVLGAVEKKPAGH